MDNYISFKLYSCTMEPLICCSRSLEPDLHYSLIGREFKGLQDVWDKYKQ